jgi:tRNA A-37 threonylcarbamoyl transferase component Bud32
VADRNDILPPRYSQVRHVARGGMGDVYRATDTALGRTVAVKVLAERYADDEGIRERFTREALAAARLSGTPNTVTIFDVGEWNDRPYIVMELAEGGTLEDRLRAEGAQEPSDVLRWLAAAADGLDAAHQAGIVHRDVKPGNLLLDGREEVRVADFGVASAVGMDSMTMTGTVLGTAGYLSPEQAMGKRATPASDRYALGVVAWELLTGERPYASSSTTAEAAAHVHAPIPSLSERTQLPPELDPVFRRALAKDPGERYGSAVEFVAALREALSAASAPTQRIAAVEERHEAGAVAATAARRPSPLVWAALAALALLALGGGLALAGVLGGDGDPETRTVIERRTVTEEGRVTTQSVTVTTQQETATTAPTTATTGTTAPEEGASPGEAGQLNDQAFALMNAGRYDEALPLLERAIVPLSGTGSLTEAYASYNLAKTRLELGRCDDVIPLLDRSQEVQGERREITEARRQAEEQCGD